MTSHTEVDLVEDSAALPGVGSRLKEAREALELDVKLVAQRLSIHEKYVLALEADDYAVLPGSAYVKGYIRAYARLVNLSGDSLVQAYQAWSGEVTPSRAVKSINTLDEQVKVSHPLMKVSLYAFVLAILAVSVWWWQTQRSAMPVLEEQTETPISNQQSSGADLDPDAASNNIAILDAPASDAQVVDAQVVEENIDDVTRVADETTDVIADETQTNDPPPVITTADSESEETVAETSASTTTEVEDAGVVAASASEPAEPEAAVSSTLFIAFVDDCWVSVRDEARNVLFAGTQHAGDTLSLDISASPAYLLLGRASAVSEARFAGQLLAVNTSADSDVARLTLTR